ncbi:hypothetical protein HIM_04733 [Hirsutella minnesotensis 3608]|uniref:Uncharacterized protein n=1 Tax=Hirsutella minnesotensis 3608 TaxID=1043627 RepID=A0A0F8A5T9_9HYPO|nr:hypothetical protein HIM_04733 [Hirsutella minnesotensis 3608]
MDYPKYSAEREISNFFAKASTCRQACDARAEELVGGQATPVDIQGNCSYTVYCGPCLEYVVQFRPRPLQLDMGTASLARQIYGSLAPTVTFEGQIGPELQDKEPLYVYVMDRSRA